MLRPTGDGTLDNAEIARQLPGFRAPAVTRPPIDPDTPAAARKVRPHALLCRRVQHL